MQHRTDARVREFSVSKTKLYLRSFSQSIVLHILIVGVLLMGLFEWQKKEIPPQAPKFVMASLVEHETKKPAKTKKTPVVEKTQPKPEPVKPPEQPVKPPEPAKPEPKPEVKKPEIKAPEVKAPDAKPIQKEVVKPEAKKPPEKKEETKQAKKEEPKKKVEPKPKKEWGIQNVDALLAEEESEIQGKKREIEDNVQQEQENLSEIDEYQGLIRQAIARSWSRPASVREVLEVTLRISMLPNGEVVSVDVVKSSGNQAFDRSAVIAVQRAHTLPVPRDADLFDRYFRRLKLVFRPEDF